MIYRDVTQGAETLLRILIVEDNPLLQEVYSAALEPLDVSIGQAFTGIEAVRLIESQRFDLLICDLGLPGGMLGNAVVALFHERQAGHVVVVSGAEDDPCLPQGAMFLRKPFTMASLIDVVIACDARNQLGRATKPIVTGRLQET